MEGQEIVVHTGQPAAIATFTTRDLVAMGFRHRKALLISFFAVLLRHGDHCGNHAAVRGAHRDTGSPRAR